MIVCGVALALLAVALAWCESSSLHVVQDGTTPADSAAKAGYTDLASLISGYTSPRSGRYVPNKEAAFQDAAEAAPPTQASGPQLHPRVAAAFAQQVGMGKPGMQSLMFTAA